MNGREQMLLRWCSAWLDRNRRTIDEVFAENIVYSECYGPEYREIAQIKRWFDDWNQRGRVLEWTIRKVYHDGNTVIATWYFRCEYDGVVDGFDGVTIAEFNDAGKIVSICEYQSKAEHVFPYGKEQKESDGI